MAKIGIIGGSGLCNIDGIKIEGEKRVKTPFGMPSSEIVTGRLEGREVAFLPRHGKDHKISPTHINYRANIYALKELGVERIISLSACGSLKEELRPMDFVVPDQFVDRTNNARKFTFFDEGLVAHISFAHPVCGELAKIVHKAASDCAERVHYGGTYLNMEGPQFSTLAESNLYRQWGMDIIGMTNMAEARLAREAEICYVTLAAVTDYDCWRASGEEVTVEEIMDNLKKNVETSKRILGRLIKVIPDKRECACKEALKNAIVTPREAISAETRTRLDLMIGRYLK